MDREEIDTIWHKALQQAIKDGEEFTRYHFAALVANAEREACARVCEDEIKRVKPIYSVVAENVLKAIRARGQE